MTSTPREQGHTAGVADARAAWVGTTWRRGNHVLPVWWWERSEWLAGYASGFAEYNRSVNVGGTQ